MSYILKSSELTVLSMFSLIPASIKKEKRGCLKNSILHFFTFQVFFIIHSYVIFFSFNNTNKKINCLFDNWRETQGRGGREREELNCKQEFFTY